MPSGMIPVTSTRLWPPPYPVGPLARWLQQPGDRLAFLQYILRPAVVVGEGRAGIDAQDAVQGCQHVLHPDGIADDTLAACVGGAEDLAGLQPAAGDPQESCLRPVAPSVGRGVA